MVSRAASATETSGGWRGRERCPRSVGSARGASPERGSPSYRRPLPDGHVVLVPLVAAGPDAVAGGGLAPRPAPVRGTSPYPPPDQETQAEDAEHGREAPQPLHPGCRER